MERFLKRYSKKIIIGVLIFVGVCLVAAGGTWWSYRNANWDSNILATVNGENITKADLNRAIYAQNFVGTPENPSELSDEQKDVILKSLVDQKIIEQECTKQNITVSEDEINAEIAKRDIKYDTFTTDQKAVTKESAKSTILENKLKEKILGWREGEYLLFRFDEYYDLYDTGLAKKGDAQAIAEQRTYAQKLAQQTYDKLISGSITLAQAKETLLADPIIGEKALASISATFGNSFGKDDFEYSSGQLNATVYNLREEILKVKAGDYSEPFVFKNLYNNEYSEQAFAIVYVDKASEGSTASFDGWLASQESLEGVTVHYFAQANDKETSYLSATPVYAASDIYECFPPASHQAAVRIRTEILTATGAIATFPGVVIHLSDASTGQYMSAYNSSCAVVSSAMDSSASHLVRDDGTVTHYYSGQGSTVAGYYGYMYNCLQTNFGYLLVDSVPAVSGASGGSWWYTARASNVGLVKSSDFSWLPVGTELGGGNISATFKMNYNGSLNGQTGDLWIQYRPVYQPNQTLTVTKTGTGTGTVVSTNPDGIIGCGSTCSASVTWNTNVTLTATPTNGSTFAGWGGACSGTSTTCTVTMNTARNVTATFTANVTPTISCNVTPETGLAPLVAKVTATLTNASGGTVDYDMNADGTYEYTGKAVSGTTSTVYYTYSTAGNYTVKVRHSTGLTATCGPGPVTVSNPSSNSGGEVRP